MKPEIYSSGDYAGMTTGKYSFYYGYEQIDPVTEQWCFTAKVNGKEKMRIPTEQLDYLGGFDGPLEYLMAGIAMFLNK